MPHTASLSLNITDNILLRVKQIHRTADLKPMERVYLANLILDCGKQGLSFAHRSTLAEEVKIEQSTARSVERSLKRKGYLCVFEHRGVWHRSPWPEQANAFIQGQKPTPETTEASEPAIESYAQSMPPQEAVPQAPPVTDTPLPCYEHNPRTTSDTAVSESAEAAEPSYTHPPIKKTGAKAPRQNTYNGAPLPVQPVDNSPKQPTTANTGKKVSDKANNKLFTTTKSGRNPYGKNRFLVRHMVDEIVDTLNIQQSWAWIAKIVWSISEEAEQALYHCVRWVREEIECCRSHSPAGLLTWKLREQGILPSLR